MPQIFILRPFKVSLQLRETILVVSSMLSCSISSAFFTALLNSFPILSIFSTIFFSFILQSSKKCSYLLFTENPSLSQFEYSSNIFLKQALQALSFSSSPKMFFTLLMVASSNKVSSQRLKYRAPFVSNDYSCSNTSFLHLAIMLKYSSFMKYTLLANSKGFSPPQKSPRATFCKKCLTGIVLCPLCDQNSHIQQMTALFSHLSSIHSLESGQLACQVILHCGQEIRVAMIIYKEQKVLQREESILLVLEDLSHAVYFAYAVEFRDTAQVGKTVQAEAEVDQGCVVGLEGAVLKEKVGLNWIYCTFDRFSQRQARSTAERVRSSQARICTQSNLNFRALATVRLSSVLSGWLSAFWSTERSLTAVLRLLSSKLISFPLLVPILTFFVAQVSLIFVMSFLHAALSDEANGSQIQTIDGFSWSSLKRQSIIWSLSKGVLGFSSQYFLVQGVKRVSAAQERPMPKCYFPPQPAIASQTSFKLSAIVSNGHIKVPSGDNFKAASPPFPLTIALRTPCSAA